ncbi:MAG: DUF5996 family protein [Bdellovibrionaceae bacterium]|nr:DUF5996 family protein [Pseudobdellovibrionaceae bacterium]
MGAKNRMLPEISFEKWNETRPALHRFMQIVGKIRMACEPPRNHWWHVPLYLTPVGLTTTSMPVDDSGFPDHFEIQFDLLNHNLVGRNSWGVQFEFALENLSVADFYSHLLKNLKRLGVETEIKPFPYKIEPNVPFYLDTQNRYRDPAIVTQVFHAFRFAEHSLKRFASSFIGKTSPIHLFWHSLDLAMTRFSGEPAPQAPSEDVDPVAHEAYSHQVVSFGFWAGDEKFPQAAFYSYTWPSPEALTRSHLVPSRAFWQMQPTGPLALLKYEDVRGEMDPGAAVQKFFKSAFDNG